MYKNFSSEAISCTCKDVEHCIVVEIGQFNDGDCFLNLNIHLCSRGIISRIKSAILHILGKKTKYGDFYNLSFETHGPFEIEQAEKLRNVIDEYIKMAKDSKNDSKVCTSDHK